jgi:hypothetical protein
MTHNNPRHASESWHPGLRAMISPFHWMPAFAGMTLIFMCSVTHAETTVTIDPSACREVTRHVPDADVAYKPGVDVHGKKVAPADLSAPAISNKDIEQAFRIEINNDTAKLFGIPVPTAHGIPMAQPTMRADIYLKDGKPYLNDKPLDPSGQEQLAILCKQQKVR